MITLDPKELATPDLQRTLQFAVGPRPIALVSTVDREGRPNLSPFSFFNVFSANPPILVFSPARRVRDNTTKHTLENVLATKECVIHSVNYDMTAQVSLSSTEYAEGVNEFVKAGFTQVPSDTVAPPRAAEAPVAMECTVNDVISLGDQGGAGNLVICEVQKIHISEDVLDSDGRMDQAKLDLVARLGGDWYARANESALFEVEKPLKTQGVGFDALPRGLRQSKAFTGNDLGQLANVEVVPSLDQDDELFNHPRIKAILDSTPDAIERREQLYEYAKELIEKDKINKAWKVLLIDGLSSQNSIQNL